jgi:hypothetical protein
MTELLVTSGARRGCGTREPGGAYLAVPLGPGGSPVEAFLIDPPTAVDARALGLAAVGTTMIERDGITHVLDVVGREHYPTVAGFVDEARRLGVSRRISKTAAFWRLTRDSRLLLLHPHALIANAAEFPATGIRCPCEIPEHQAEGFSDMCARLWWQEPLAGAQRRLAIFASFPIAQIEAHPRRLDRTAAQMTKRRCEQQPTKRRNQPRNKEATAWEQP